MRGMVAFVGDPFIVEFDDAQRTSIDAKTAAFAEELIDDHSRHRSPSSIQETLFPGVLHVNTDRINEIAGRNIRPDSFFHMFDSIVKRTLKIGSKLALYCFTYER